MLTNMQHKKVLGRDLGNMINKIVYYVLAITWGLPLTLIGGLVALVLLATGHRPKRFGWCLYFEVGTGWGGLELGLIFLCQKNAPYDTKAHEFGHSIQNCFFGPLMIFIVSIPSAIRYWVRIWKTKRGEKNLPPYDSIWFEGQATQLGKKYMEKINTK